jgi:hypothetical protein
MIQLVFANVDYATGVGGPYFSKGSRRGEFPQKAHGLPLILGWRLSNPRRGESIFKLTPASGRQLAIATPRAQRQALRSRSHAFGARNVKQRRGASAHAELQTSRHGPFLMQAQHYAGSERVSGASRAFDVGGQNINAGLPIFFTRRRPREGGFG